MRDNISAVVTPHCLRFRELFDGLSRVYGQYVIGGTPDERGKVTGKAVTIRQPITDELIAAHLSGMQSIGVVPIRDDGTVRFGAIDIDVYEGLDHIGIANSLAKASLPLVTCRSKSGGAHLFCFTSEPVPAVAMRKKLTDIAAMLGHGGVEIFPKQNKLCEGECGGWLNMPYFGTTRHAIRADGSEMTLPDFILAAEESRVEKAFFAKSGTDAPFSQGPPCLNHLVMIGIPAGTRNDTLFNLAVYARRAYPETWKEEVENYNRTFLVPPLNAGEIITITKSVAKKEYAYGCSKPPLVQHCNKSLCRTRRYGVGTGGENFPVLGPLVKFDSKPPRYLWEVDGVRISLDTDQILNYWQFKRACFQELNKVLPDLKQRDWQPLLAKAMEELHTEPVEDVSPEAQFWELLEGFCDTWAASSTGFEHILMGRAHTNGGRTYFRMADLLTWLDSKKFRACSPQDIGAILKQRGATSEQRKIRGKNVRLWSVAEFAGEDDTELVPVDSTIF